MDRLDAVCRATPRRPRNRNAEHVSCAAYEDRLFVGIPCMCGIAGVLRLDGGPVERAPLERMIGCLAHRGPDGSGIHVAGSIGLGHRRLSILDPTEAGAQPMFRGANALSTTARSTTTSSSPTSCGPTARRSPPGTDTEVILAAYDAGGSTPSPGSTACSPSPSGTATASGWCWPGTAWASSRCTSAGRGARSRSPASRRPSSPARRSIRTKRGSRGRTRASCTTSCARGWTDHSRRRSWTG